MAFLWSKKRPAPDRVPTDDVIPLHSFDDMDVYRAVVLDFSLRFDDVLDHEKLRLALVRLLEIGDWRKLGARLRRNVRYLHTYIRLKSRYMFLAFWY
jgi:hypothetical protein